MNQARMVSGRGLVRLSIRQAFAFGTLNGKRRPFPIGDFASVVTEIKFRQITVQMLLAAMLVHTTHATLEDREVAFNGIGVNVAASVFLG
jgi:hypothetical protein